MIVDVNMTKEEAQQIIEEQVMANKKDCALMPDSTTEYDTCFTFFYQSTSYLKSGNMNTYLRNDCNFQRILALINSL